MSRDKMLSDALRQVCENENEKLINSLDVSSDVHFSDDYEMKIADIMERANEEKHIKCITIARHIATAVAVFAIIGSAVLLITLLVTGRPIVAGVADNLPLVLYVGVVVTGLGYLVYFLGVLYSDASTGSIAFFVKPAIAPFIAIAVLHETIYWNTIVGIGLLLTGSVLTIYDTFAYRNAVQAEKVLVQQEA